MSIRFYTLALQRALISPQFRQQAISEVRQIIKHKLPSRLASPGSEHVFCHSATERGQGKWLPPGNLPLRPCVYGFIFDQAGRVLLVKDAFSEDRWLVPGGGIERGETLEQALRREVLEETGLQVEMKSVVENIDEFVIMPTGRAVHGLLHFYLVRVTGGIIKHNGNGFDTSSTAYFDLESLDTVTIGGEEPVRQVIRKAHTLIQQGPLHNCA